MIALIMAGGFGTRFWPLSRRYIPKQYICVEGNESMLQKTVQRLLQKLAIRDIYVVTTADQEALVRKHLPALPVENIILEPFGMNTAPCIALSVEYLRSRYAGDEPLLVLPADHIINDVPAFLDSLVPAESAARSGYLVTFGIVPGYPATGYGYIEAGKELNPTVVSPPNAIQKLQTYPIAHEVIRFKEKPDKQTAEQFLTQGNFYWNSGMFCWSLNTIYSAFQQHLPAVIKHTQAIANIWHSNGQHADINDLYAQMPRLPIDIGILEQASNRCVIPVSIGWSDVGSWKALAEITGVDADGNYFKTSGLAIDANNNYIRSSKFTAIIGLDDVCVIETPDAILVCVKDKAEEVKKVVDYLQLKGDDNLI